MAQSGKSIGRYEVIKLIGRGGMGRIFLGRDTQTGQEVAIKVLPANALEDDPGLLERLKRESEALRVLNHPNIVKILDVVEEAGEYSLILEYVSGGSLSDLLNREPQLSLKVFMKIALELADALARAHHLKIIHRDIKPGNILIAEDGTPRLTDFGLARMEQQQNMTQSGAMVGSIGYLSPEAIKSQPPDHRMDIWSLGVVFYEMLSGRRPFEADSNAGVLAGILLEPVPDITRFRDDLPPKLVELIESMLEKEPDQRISSVRRVGAELEDILEGMDTSDKAQLPAQVKRLVDKARFHTPTPTTRYEEQTVVPSSKEFVPTSSSGSGKADSAAVEAARSMAGTAGGMAADQQQTTSAGRWPLIAGIGALLAVLVGAIAFALSSSGEGSTAAPAPTETPAPIAVAPVGEGEMMVLVANLEPLGAERPNIDRFIRDDLQQTLELGAPYTHLRIREYPQALRSTDEAYIAAETYQAPIIIWGNYTDEFIELEIVLSYFETAPLPLRFLRDAGNVRVRLTNERQQSVSGTVLIAAALWWYFAGDGFEPATMLVALQDLAVTPAEVTGQNMGAHIHRFFSEFFDDTEASLASLDAAQRLDAANPIHFHLRGLALHRLGRVDESEQALNTAVRLSSQEWPTPFYGLASVFASTGQNQESIAEIDRLLLLSPEDWLAYTVRGSMYYGLGDYPNAEADLQRALTLEPQSNLPYLMAMNVLIRQGRIQEVQSLLQIVLAEYPDPTLANRIILVANNQDDFNSLYGRFLSAFANLILGQYATAIREIDAALESGNILPELYLFQGVAHCLSGDFEAARDSYTSGIEMDPEFTVLYLLRADTRRRTNDLPGAAQDFLAAQQTDAWPNFAPLIADPATANLGCESFLDVAG